jgi:hypothetical protein
MTRTTLYTSLPPKLAREIANIEVGRSYLTECIKSWKRAGFEIISLNCAQEIRQLKPFGHDVEYREVAASRPRIGDFLHAIRASEKPVAGIINADILLSNHPALLDAIMDHAAGGMVVAERMNIDPLMLQLTWQTCHGFDAFIFATEPLLRIDLDCELSFGEPWWDYWLPLAYLAAGGRLMTTSVPLIFHLDHVQKWQDAHWSANGNKIVTWLLRRTGLLPDDFVTQLRQFSSSATVSQGDLESFAYSCFAWLRRMSEMTKISPPPKAAASVSTLVALIDNPEVCSVIGELSEAQWTIINSKEFGAKALLESLHDQIGDQEANADRARVLAGLYRQMQNMSSILQGKRIRSGEDALRTMTEGTRILTSRKANLRHFLALNAAWFRRRYAAMTRGLRRRLSR